jgi:hypothetical protein
MFHVSGLRLDWYVVLVNEYCTNAETTLYVSCALVSHVAQYTFEERRGYSPMWLNLTGSELKPHAVLSRKYRFYKAETLPGR